LLRRVLFSDRVLNTKAIPVVMSKKELCMSLSRLKTFENPDMQSEQYPTDSEIAGDALWKANMLGDIEGKVIVDLGAGTGILGLGACFLGAKKAFLVEKDKAALEIAHENKLSMEEDTGIKLNVELINKDIFVFEKKADVVFMNPPFGTKDAGADTKFLERAFKLAPVVYSFHKSSTKPYIDKLSVENGFSVTHYFDYHFPLKNTLPFHKRRIERVRVGFWRMEKKDQ
jgi:putative methylase